MVCGFSATDYAKCHSNARSGRSGSGRHGLLLLDADSIRPEASEPVYRLREAIVGFRNATLRSMQLSGVRSMPGSDPELSQVRSGLAARGTTFRETRIVRTSPVRPQRRAAFRLLGRAPLTLEIIAVTSYEKFPHPPRTWRLNCQTRVAATR
jgi:hypothetical protein